MKLELAPVNTMRVCGTKGCILVALCLLSSAGTGTPKLSTQPSLCTRGEDPGRSRDGLVDLKMSPSLSLKHGL